jgi:uncharacterized Fe-S center protein
MFEKLKQLLRAKISITIVYPGIVTLVEPKTIVTESFIKHVAHSNLRFVAESRIESDGKHSVYYSTEIFEGTRWAYVANSLSGDKNKAMELHLKIASGISLKPAKVKEVLWQGLPKDEAEMWVAMQTKVD